MYVIPVRSASSSEDSYVPRIYHAETFAISVDVPPLRVVHHRLNVPEIIYYSG